MGVPKLTEEQGAIITAFTGTLSCDVGSFHKYVEQLLGHPVYTHEMASKEWWEVLKELARDDFLAIVVPE